MFNFTNKPQNHALRTLLMLIVYLGLSRVSIAQENTNEYLNLSIEELSTLDVTSVTGVEEQWFRSPAAVYVITQEDIDRTGHQSLAELLRIVPGIDISQPSSNNWTIGTRGVTGNYTDSLLMLIDGRPVQDPLQAFIRWDTLDLILKDISNIEVIRGAGSTLWGSAAVNGVINVTTKSARKTQGWQYIAATGSHEKVRMSLRYGDQIDDSTYFRVWGKYTNRDAFKKTDGSDHYDDWDLFTTGFRIDSDGEQDYSWSVQGGISFSDQLGSSMRLAIPGEHRKTTNLVSDTRVETGYLQATLKKQINENNKWSVLGAFEHNNRRNVSGLLTKRNTYTADYRHRYSINDEQLFVWGAGLRINTDDTENSDVEIYDPQSELTYDANCFIQSSTNLFHDDVRLIIGSKFEHNRYVGFEYQPSLRLTWTPNTKNTLWTAISRAVRPPSRSTADSSYIPSYVTVSGFNFPIISSGSRDLKSEELISYELGYRTHLTHDLTLDVASFYNRYENILTQSEEAPFSLNNSITGNVIGGEINVVWTPAPSLRTEAGYSFAKTKASGDYEYIAENSYPQHHFHLRSYLDIGENLELNGALYYVSDKDALHADKYLRLDTGLTWKINPTTSISLWGQNLLDTQHSESYDDARDYYPTEIPRSFYIQLNMKF